MLPRADLDPLAREAMRVESKRLRNMERTQRILDSKTRTMGVDKDALDRQVEERQQRSDAVKAEHEAQGAIMNGHAQALTQLDLERRAYQRSV